MNGPEHYREAERLIAVARDGDLIAEAVAVHGVDDAVAGVGHILAEAQVHATLALAAAHIDVALGYHRPGVLAGPSAWASAVNG